MKELTKTPFISALLSKAAGEDADQAKLHVFEVRATSTIALRGKDGTIFEKAKISPHTISELASAVNEDALPLMMDHDLRGTPYGKFFYAMSVPMDTGEIELRGYMYVDDTETTVLGKLESASIEEVSIQFAPARMMCSECGFDYVEAANNDNFMPFIDLACDEGHQIGRDGVHINMVGVKEAVELSLVSRGAAKNSKIIGSSDAMLDESAQRLAASGVDVLTNYYCTASINDEGVENVDLSLLTTKLSALTEDKITLSADLAAEKATVVSMTANRDSEKERADNAEAEVARLTAEAEANANDESVDSETVAKMSTQIGKTFVALKALDGEVDAKVPEDISEAITFIEANEARLSALIPVGGVSEGAGSGKEKKTEKSVDVASLAAFKSKN